MLWIILTSCAVLSACLPLWGTYEPQRLFSILNLNTSQRVQLGFIFSPDSSTTTTFVNQVNSSEYGFHDGRSYFQKSILGSGNESIQIKGTLGSGYSANITIDNPQSYQTIILFSDRVSDIAWTREGDLITHQGLRIRVKMNCTVGWSSVQTIGMFDTFQHLEQGGNTLAVRCQGTGKSRISVQEMAPDIKIQDVKQQFGLKVDSIMKHYGLKSKYTDIVEYAVSNTLGSMAFIQSKYGRHVGLKSKRPDQQVLGLYPLVIDILSNFDYHLAHQLFNHLVEKLEDEVIYSEDDQVQLTALEHTEIFLIFPNPKTIKVLNGIIYKSLFHKVNHMIGDQSMDYHSSKQLHPILSKMLEITWESDYKYLKAQSVYTQSFLDDLYVNSHQETPSISVSKTSWLIKTIRILIELNNQAEVLSKGQLSSLEDGLRSFFRSSCYNKKEKLFRSINVVGRSRYYASALSYQNFLPLLYKLEPKFDQSYSSVFKMLANMTSATGVTSQEKSEHNDFEANFRSRVWPYFNHKIIKALETPQDLESEFVLKDLQDQKKGSVKHKIHKLEEVLNTLKPLELQQGKMLNTYVKQQIVSDWGRTRKLFSSWSPDGLPFDSHSELILVNILFLR